ncbi:fluoride efflux transporter CrcB [Speluncibacter jeojiensis]|uniref:Fluoride-specific ion channel FluC n=1 Tax=Speluncibacter jeojiensis TaxID=2710754 RepID=A0A9X4LZJ5_9ACTN|nr:fluoride efflux transporter CrcB [Corynebacteriales bacterium D3-21]
MSVAIWAGVMVIGGCGAVLRFLVDSTVSRRTGRGFPFGTLAVNISGAVALGLVTGLALGHTATLLAGTAAVGAYTTFSTWMFETQRMSEERRLAAGALNVVLSLAAGLAAAALGHWIGGRL